MMIKRQLANFTPYRAGRFAIHLLDIDGIWS